MSMLRVRSRVRARAIELMEVGLRLKRANLTRPVAEAAEAEIEAAFERWLFADE